MLVAVRFLELFFIRFLGLDEFLAFLLKRLTVATREGVAIRIVCWDGRWRSWGSGDILDVGIAAR